MADLTPNQRKAINEMGQVFIGGEPGTGKSVVSLYRHINNTKNNKNSFLVTYTKSLTQYLQSTARTYNEKAANRIKNVHRMFKYKYDDNTREWRWLDNEEKWQQGRGPKFHEIIIDEAQDLDATILKHLFTLCDSISVGADYAQSVYNGISLDDLKDKVNAKNNSTMTEFTLNQVFRSPYYIYVFINAFFGKRADSAEYLEQKPKGNKPIIYQNVNDEIGLIKDIVNDNPGLNVGIFLPYRDQVESYHNMLKNEIEISFYVSQSIAAEDIVILSTHICTFKSAKWLEFDVVIIPRIEGVNDVKEKSSDNDNIITQNDYYVGMTRARSRLFLLTVGKASNITMLKNVDSEYYETRARQAQQVEPSIESSDSNDDFFDLV